jgi:hypothetical protein
LHAPPSSLQVQTISFLSHLRSRGVHGPFLIIGPLSTLRNWSGEFKRFCPSMNVLEYHGSGAKARAALRAEHMPVGELLNAHAQPWGSRGEYRGARLGAIAKYSACIQLRCAPVCPSWWLGRAHFRSWVVCGGCTAKPIRLWLHQEEVACDVLRPSCLWLMRVLFPFCVCRVPCWPRLPRCGVHL